MMVFYMNKLPKSSLDVMYITGKSYVDFQLLSEFYVYERMCGYAIDFFWKKCEVRDVELMLDITGNLDAQL